MIPTPSDKTRILLVEDEMDHALQIQAFVGALDGASVTHVQDGIHALDLLERESWDLVIADLNVPGADGFEVIRAAKRKSHALPVLATTGYVQEHYWDQAFRAGADQVVVKPLGRDDFLLRVRHLLGPTALSRGPDAASRKHRQEVMLVIEGRLGDGIMGCGGAMAIASRAGAHVVVLPVSDGTPLGEGEVEAAREGLVVLGANLRVTESLAGDPKAMSRLIARVVDELGPSMVYLPAGGDADPLRATASRVAVEACIGRTNMYGYLTATTPSSFRPRRVVDIRNQIDTKARALGSFRQVRPARRDLDPELARAYARYWGRLKDFTEVEVFEVIQEQTT